MSDIVCWLPPAKPGEPRTLAGEVGERFMLTAKRVERTKTPGRYRDGMVKGLLLQISASGAKSWVLRYDLHGKEHMMGLGSAADFTLKEARERARAARQLLADGHDPLDAKRQRRAEIKLAAAKRLNFRAAAERYFDQHEAKWKSAVHRNQFLASLRAHAFPQIGEQDVATITLADILCCIEPIWTTKSVTADRVRNRIRGRARLVCGARSPPAWNQSRPLERTSRSGTARGAQGGAGRALPRDGLPRSAGFLG